MAFDFSVSDAELGAHISHLDAIIADAAQAKDKVTDTPNIVAWTQFAAQILGDDIAHFFTGFKDDTVSAHSALTETKAQMEVVRQAYADTELTNTQLVGDVTMALQNMPGAS